MLTRKRWTAPNYTGNAAQDYANLTKSISDYLLSLEAKGSLTIGEAQITANQGIAFPATQVASTDANTLDDYQEAKTWTPTVTSGSGSITTLGTVVATYEKIGRTVLFYLDITITTNGTAATDIRATLPFSVSAGTINAFGWENTVGFMILGAATSGSTLVIKKYDFAYPGSDGARFFLRGIYTAT